jgi:hypothetical protein
VDNQQVGVLFDGSPVYCYRSPTFHVGLMAHDAERETPEAVVEINGFKAVDYRKATERPARISELRLADATPCLPNNEANRKTVN